jgi:6-phosphogluconolactonase
VRSTLGKNATGFQLVVPNPSLPLQEYVQDYAKKLNELFTNRGLPDVLTIGMGPDGHIASLFPPVPSQAFDENLTALHSTTDKFAVRDRISITMPVIKKAKKHVFLMKGKDKLELWNEMISANVDHTRWPAHDVLAEKKTTLIVGV